MRETIGVLLVLAAIVGVTWHTIRVHGESRWRAVLDRYAEQEEAKRTHPWKGHQH
jgi:hypothetical protein